MATRAAVRAASDAEPGLEREFQRDQRLERLFRRSASIIALSSLITLYVLIIQFKRTSPWLVALTLYMIGTRASSFVASRAFLYPRFLLRLDDPDPEVARASVAVLERHRTTVVRPILKDLWRDFEDPAVAAIEAAELASLARAYDVERHRRFGRRYFVIWCVLTILIWGTVIATRGGPTG